MTKKIILIFVFSWSLLTLFASGVVESQDGLQYLSIARQMYYQHSFVMPAAKYPDNNIHMNTQTGRGGMEYSPTGLGYSLALLPAVAIEDVFNKVADLPPSNKFPLDNDWPIMLFGSMTNAWFGALFILCLFLFLKSFDFTEKKALIFSMLLFASSNLFVYSKHSFAHMLFISFMWLSFYFLRLYKLTHFKRNIVFAGIAYGIVMLSYNPTYILPLPGLIVYYLTSLSWNNRSLALKTMARDVLLVILAILPFFILYSWFNWIRFGGAISTGYGTGAISVPPVPPAFVFFEGIWGLLFSPGKSIFLFTPMLLIPLVFWTKFRKAYFPELAVGITMAMVYLPFIASLYAGPDFFPWHGEASFGPRYILPIIPFGLLLAALLYQHLSKLQRLVIWWPLLTLGLFIQIVGTLIPYQVRFSGLEYQYLLNGHRITYDVYANFLPRFSPLYSMTKWFVKTALLIPQYYLLSNQAVFIDGTHGVLKTTQGEWRQVEPISLLKVKKQLPISIEFKNHTATWSGYRALKVSAQQNQTILGDITIPASQSARLVIPIENVDITEPIAFATSYVGTDSAKVAHQVPFVSGLFVEGKPVSLNNYYYPYVSRVSQKLYGVQYYYWGNENVDLWHLWSMRSINYVHTFDLWWLRPLHYWDLPKNLFALLLTGNVTLCIVTGYFLKKQLDK